MPGVDWQKVVDAQSGDRRAFLGKASDAAKFIWAGSFALFFGGLTAAEKTPLRDLFKANEGLLFLAAELGAAAFLFDFLKNLAAARLARQLEDAVSRVTSDTAREQAYNRVLSGSFMRQINHALFWLSVLAAVGSGALMAWVVYLFYNPPSP